MDDAWKIPRPRRQQSHLRVAAVRYLEVNPQTHRIQFNILWTIYSLSSQKLFIVMVLKRNEQEGHVVCNLKFHITFTVRPLTPKT